MTAVRGPFVFASDRWEDRFIDLAKRAGCGSLAVQVGVTSGHAPNLIERAGMDVIGWGACFDPPVQREWLSLAKPKVWMPQAETTAEFEALVKCLSAHVFAGPIEPVMTSGGMETEKPNATDDEIKAERLRRRNLLDSFGVTKVWVEVYAQDADASGQWWLGNVDWMCAHFTNAFGFREAHPVIGLWNNVPVDRYVLLAHGRQFGAWRAEQMVDARYDEIAAVPDSLEELMEKIGFQDGLTGFAAWLKAQPGVQQRGPKYDPANIATWPWPEKLERTLRLLKTDHDTRAGQ